MGAGLIHPAFPSLPPTHLDTRMHAHTRTHSAHMHTQCIHVHTQHEHTQCMHVHSMNTHVHARAYTRAHVCAQQVHVSGMSPRPVSAPLRDPGGRRLDGSNNGAEVTSQAATGRLTCPVSLVLPPPGGETALPPTPSRAAPRGLGLSPRGLSAPLCGSPRSVSSSRCRWTAPPWPPRCPRLAAPSSQ